MNIASLSPAATEIIFALGIGQDIVCVDQFSNFPDEAKAIPHLRGHQTMNGEELRKFNPDIVLTGTVIQEKLAHELKTSGFGVVHQDPRTITAIYESIRQLGAVLERSTEADALVLKMQQGFNAVKKRSGVAAVRPSPELRIGSRILQRPHVYVEEWHLPPMASGNWVPEVVRIAGGEPFPIKDGDLSREVSLKEIQTFDPDLIAISWCGAGSLAPKELLLNRPGWETLRAVRAEQRRAASGERLDEPPSASRSPLSAHVRVIDDSLLNRPGPRLVEGAHRIFGWIFELMH